MLNDELNYLITHHPSRITHHDMDALIEPRELQDLARQDEVLVIDARRAADYEIGRAHV